GLADHLIHRQRDEVAEHHVADRAHARHRGADADAGVARLGDRRVDDPLGAELLDEPREGLERVAGLGHVFADEEHARVAPHLLRDRFLDRLAVRQLSLAHDRPPFICAPGRPWPQARLARSGRGVKWRRALNPSTRISAMATRARPLRRSSGSTTRWPTPESCRRKIAWRPPTSSIGASYRSLPTIPTPGTSAG